MPTVSSRAKTARGKSAVRQDRFQEEETRRITPHHVEAEQALIASCVHEGGQDSVSRCIEARIISDNFYMPAHQIIYEALIILYDKQEPLDEVILTKKLSDMGQLEAVGGASYINEVLNRVETHAHLQHYIKIVKDTSLLRGLIRTCQKTIEDAQAGQHEVEHFLNDVEQQIFRLSESRLTDSAIAMDTIMKEATLQVHYLIEKRGAVTGVTTGFDALDRFTSGWHAPQMVVIASRPGLGKTSIALNMAEAAILPKSGEPVPTLMFSLEMGVNELGLRLLCSRARANQTKLKDGFLGKDKLRDISNTAQEMMKAPLFIDDSPSLNIMEIRAKARRMKARHKIGLVIIDYLQLVNSINPSLPRHEQLGEVSRGVKAMAKELQLPVIALCQLNRETEREKRQPRMSDLRESGSIEQDADIVLLIAAKKGAENQEETDNVVARDLIIAKQRNGPTGIIELIFNKSLTRFENSARESTNA